MKCWVVSWKYLFMFKYPIRYTTLSSVDIGIQNIRFLYLCIAYDDDWHIFFNLFEKQICCQVRKQSTKSWSTGTFYRTYT